MAPADMGPAACPTLRAPFGTDEGDVLSPATSFVGLPEGSDTQATLEVGSLYDCDGRKGIHAIVLSNAAQWCGVCKSEARTLEDDMVKRWGPRGVRFWTLLYEDSSGAPATLATARAWRQAYGLDHVAIAVDPDFTLSHPGTNNLPVHAIVDPRTLEVVAKPEGSVGVDADLDALLRKNGH
jgi:thiol-disulfide isomerase/thioredoxin